MLNQQGIAVFWWWQWSEFTLYFERLFQSF